MRTFLKGADGLHPRGQFVRTVEGDVRHITSTGIAPVTLPIALLDFQTGDFTQWAGIHAARPEQVTIVATPARSGYASTARFLVAPGDATFGQTAAERAEVTASATSTGNPSDGMAQWFAWSSFFPTGTYVDPGAWLAFTQWHQSAKTGVPNIAFYLTTHNPPQVRLRVRGKSLNLVTGAVGYVGEWLLGYIPLNTWVDFAVYVVWSSEPTIGHVIVKINGVQVVDTAAATLYAGMSAYMKQGIYRANSAQTHTIYHTGTRHGPTEASVLL